MLTRLSFSLHQSPPNSLKSVSVTTPYCYASAHILPNFLSYPFLWQIASCVVHASCLRRSTGQPINGMTFTCLALAHQSVSETRFHANPISTLSDRAAIFCRNACALAQKLLFFSVSVTQQHNCAKSVKSNQFSVQYSLASNKNKSILICACATANPRPTYFKSFSIICEPIYSPRFAWYIQAPQVLRTHAWETHRPCTMPQRTRIMSFQPSVSPSLHFSPRSSAVQLQSYLTQLIGWQFSIIDFVIDWLTLNFRSESDINAKTWSQT